MLRLLSPSSPRAPGARSSLRGRTHTRKGRKKKRSNLRGKREERREKRGHQRSHLDPPCLFFTNPLCISISSASEVLLLLLLLPCLSALCSRALPSLPSSLAGLMSVRSLLRLSSLRYGLRSLSATKPQCAARLRSSDTSSDADAADAVSHIRYTTRLTPSTFDFPRFLIVFRVNCRTCGNR